MSEHDKPDEAVPAGEGRWQRTANKMLSLPGFDHIMGLIIVVNMAVMVIDINKSADGEEGADDDELTWTGVFGWVVICIFVIELLVRLVAFQWTFWSDAWNVADFVVVTVDVAFSLIGLVAEDLFPVSILRIFRLAKLARVSKVLRVFPELRLLLAGLVSSVRAIFWGTVLVSLFLLVWSMMAVLLIHPLAKDVDFDGCSRCSRAYSSVWQASLTFWQQIVTGDSWGQATIPVIEKHPATALFFVPVFLSIGLAVMNLMLGVVVSVAQAAYDKDLAEMHEEDMRTKLENESKFSELCNEMDTDFDGVLSRHEVHSAFTTDGEFRDVMMVLGITDDDFEVAWGLLDRDGSGSVSHEEFVTCLCNMKSSDTHFMIMYIKYYMIWMKSALMKQISQQNLEAQHLEKHLEKLVEEQEATNLHDRYSIDNQSKANDVIEELEASWHGEDMDNHKLASNSTYDESPLPEQSSLSKAMNVSHGYLLQPVASATSKGLESANPDSALQACLQEVNDEIEVMRGVLKYSLKGLDGRLYRHMLRIQAKQQVVPAGKSSQIPTGESNLGPQKGGQSSLEVQRMSSIVQQQDAGPLHEVSSDFRANVISI